MATSQPQFDPAPGGPVIDVVLAEQDPAAVFAAIREGLCRPLPETDPKYFYDDRGSELFEAICMLPEYYQTRTEGALLGRIAPEVIARTGAGELVELGSGAAVKTRILLDAMSDAGTLRRFVPVDYSEGILRRTARDLTAQYPGLAVHGIVADFMAQMSALPGPGEDPRLVIFLGGTIGNFRAAAAADFLRRLAARMRPGDFLLLGTDLVKDPARLEAAYNDRAGITAAFNKNVLPVLNRLTSADFVPAGFDHRAFYDSEQRWIEMRLVSNRPQRVRLPRLGLVMNLAPGDEIRTEISAKFDHPAVERMLAAAGFTLVEWYTDPQLLFGLSLARFAG